MQNIQITSDIISRFYSQKKNRKINVILYKPFWSIIMICFALIMTTSCATKERHFQSFEQQQWIQSAIECTPYRLSVIENMEKEFQDFYGLDENELLQYFGKPTETHLYTRGQKFIIYPLSCKSAAMDTKQLRFRFSALGYVNEVLVVN